MKLPLIAVAAFVASVTAASAQWGPPPGYASPPPPPGYGYRRPPPPQEYAPPRFREDRGWRGERGYERRRCFWRETPWGPRRVCRSGPPRW